MNVKWKPGTQHRVGADVAYTVVEELRKKNNGDVDAELVVKAATSKRNPLHAEFEWDDSAAAHEHRLGQAREILRHLVVVREEIKTDRPQRIYEVVRLPKQDDERPKNVYRTLEQIMEDPDMRAELLGRALRELISIRNRYRDLQELAVVIRSIDELVENFEA